MTTSSYRPLILGIISASWLAAACSSSSSPATSANDSGTATGKDSGTISKDSGSSSKDSGTGSKDSGKSVADTGTQPSGPSTVSGLVSFTPNTGYVQPSFNYNGGNPIINPWQVTISIGHSSTTVPSGCFSPDSGTPVNLTEVLLFTLNTETADGGDGTIAPGVYNVTPGGGMNWSPPPDGGVVSDQVAPVAYVLGPDAGAPNESAALITGGTVTLSKAGTGNWTGTFNLQASKGSTTGDITGTFNVPYCATYGQL